MTENMTENVSRAIRSSTVYHVFLISLIQCITVIMCSVTMTTQSSDGASANGIFNISADSECQNVTLLESCRPILPVPCPPLNSLHLVCDQNLGASGQTCDDRALIIDKCLHQYPGLYNNSHWRQCLAVNQCVNVFKSVLINNGCINKTVDGGDIVNVTIVKVSTTVTEVSSTSASANITLEPVVTGSSSSVTPDHTSVPSETSNISTMDEGVRKSDGEFPPISYVYPIVGAFIIAFEIVLLCIFSCYKKKRERQNVTGSLVQQEEMIEPETASPTKAALNANSVLDEDTVFKQDKQIYKSYINLKYIDDTSVESTPEKALIRT